MHIGELAWDAGVPAKTIRYYEAVGLLPAPLRASNGYRAYGTADLTRLRLIRRLRRAGVGLPELRDIVAVADNSRCAPVRERLLPLLDTRLAEIERQLGELAALRADLRRYRDDLRAALADAPGPGEPFCACDPATCGCRGVGMPDAPALALLAVLAHPDDESRIIGGTLARYAAAGVRVALYCATEGEAWRADADPDEQRRLRRRELAAACATLGIADLRLRAYPDGGLGHISLAMLAADIAAVLRATTPQIVVTFGPEGRTCHPDYIAIHHAATRAFALARQEVPSPAGPPARLYYTAVAASVARAVGWRFPVTPNEAIDVTLDVRPWLAAKRQATVIDHASQYHDPPFANVDEATRWQALAREDFVLAAGSLPLPPGERSDLFAGLR